MKWNKNGLTLDLKGTKWHADKTIHHRRPRNTEEELIVHHWRCVFVSEMESNRIPVTAPETADQQS